MFLNSKPPGFSIEGYHIARCFSLVQIGTIFIPDGLNGGKWQSQVRLTWEMPFDLRQYKKNQAPAPKQISKEYAASLYGKSHLKRHLIHWLGEEVVAHLDIKFDPYLILGRPCQIKIEHRRNENTKTWFEDISDVQPCPDSDCPHPFNEIRILTFENFSEAMFNALPDFVAQKIMRSKEYKHIQQLGARGRGGDAPF